MMSGSTIRHDYYKILEISQTADSISIKANYRRLARLRHPDKNTSATATSDFQLLQEAYSTVGDPVKRREYDVQYATANFHHTTSPQAKRSTTDTPKASGKETRQYTMQQLGIKLQQLKSQLSRQENELRNERKRLSALDREVLDLQREIENLAREQAEKMSWWGYLGSFLPGQPRETEAQKTRQDFERIEKTAVWRIKEATIKQQKDRIRCNEYDIQSTSESIRSIETDIRMEKLREEQERRKMEEILRNRMKEEMKAREKEQADKARRNREDSRKASQTSSNQSPRTKAICLHRGWWNRVDDRIVCSHCSVCTRKFAFKCPGCGKFACASCREIMKGNKPDWGRKPGANNYNSRYSGFTGDDDYFHPDWY